MLLTRPWRWLVALLVATVFMGVAVQVAEALGASQFFGLPQAVRLALFAGLIWVQCAFLIPSYEEWDRGDPLPPLPDSVKPLTTGTRTARGDTSLSRWQGSNARQESGWNGEMSGSHAGRGAGQR